MPSLCSALCTVSTLGLLVFAGFAPQEVPKDAARAAAVPGLQRFSEGLTVGDLLSAWTAETGRKFIWRDGGGIRERRLILTAVPQYGAGDADFVYESMLVSVGLGLIPAGPPESKLFVVEDVERSAVPKSRARFVARENLGTLVRHPAQVFITAFPLQHLTRAMPQNEFGPPIQQLLTNRNIEFVSWTGSSMIVAGFGPTLAAVGELMSAIDVPSEKK